MANFELIDGGLKEPCATADQIAALEFESVTRLRALSKAERLATINVLTDDVRRATVIAGEIMARDKTELVALVQANLDQWGPALLALAEAGKDARAILEILRSAEARLAICVATVEGN